MDHARSFSAVSVQPDPAESWPRANGVAPSPRLQPLEGAGLSRRERYDHIYPLLRSRGLELEYADPDIPSFDIGTRYLDEHGQPLPQPIPMTLTDALHPREGDKLVATPLHNFLIVMLFNIAWARYKSDPTFMFLMDTEFDLGIVGYSVIRPDMALLLQVENQRDIRLSRFRVNQEPPSLRLPLAVEVTSKPTKQNDFIDKLVMYADAGFEQYVILDVHQDHIKIWNFHPKSSLKAVAEREDGKTAIDALGVLIGTDGSNITFWDMETGEEIGESTNALVELKAIKEHYEAAKAVIVDIKTRMKAAEDKVKTAEDKAKAAEDETQAIKHKNRETKTKLDHLLQQLGSGPTDPQALRQVQELLNSLPD